MYVYIYIYIYVYCPLEPSNTKSDQGDREYTKVSSTDKARDTQDAPWRVRSSIYVNYNWKM